MRRPPRVGPRREVQLAPVHRSPPGHRPPRDTGRPGTQVAGECRPPEKAGPPIGTARKVAESRTFAAARQGEFPRNRRGVPAVGAGCGSIRALPSPQSLHQGAGRDDIGTQIKSSVRRPATVEPGSASGFAGLCVGRFRLDFHRETAGLGGAAAGELSRLVDPGKDHACRPRRRRSPADAVPGEGAAA